MNILYIQYLYACMYVEIQVASQLMWEKSSSYRLVCNRGYANFSIRRRQKASNLALVQPTYLRLSHVDCKPLLDSQGSRVLRFSGHKCSLKQALTSHRPGPVRAQRQLKQAALSCAAWHLSEPFGKVSTHSGLKFLKQNLFKFNILRKRIQ